MGALIEWEPWAASQKVLSACAQRFLEYDFLMLQRVPSWVGPVFIREPIPVVPAGDGDLLVIGRDGVGQPIAIEREMERVLVGTGAGRVLVNSDLGWFLLGLHVLTSWYPYGSRRDRSRLLAGAVEIREALADIDPPAVEGEDTFWSRLLDPEVFADSFCDERLQCDWGIDCLGEPIIDVRLNTSGRVVNGDYRGWTVRVEPDRPLPPCGYYVLITKDDEGYDDWVPDRESLDGYFLESGWDVDWDTRVDDRDNEPFSPERPPDWRTGQDRRDDIERSGATQGVAAPCAPLPLRTYPSRSTTTIPVPEPPILVRKAQ